MPRHQHHEPTPIERLVRTDGYRPPEHERLGRLLAMCHIAGQPGTAGDVIALTGRSTPESSEPKDAPDGPRYRSLLDRYRKRIARLADELEIEFKGDKLPRGAKCAACRRGCRYGARYCDGCGKPL